MADQPKCILVGLGACHPFVETPALRFAIELAKRHDALVTVLALPSPARLATRGKGKSAAEVATAERERIETLTQATLHGASHAVARAGLECLSEAPTSAFDPGALRLAQLARVHDLTILDALNAGDPMQRAIIEDALFDTGRPVLVVPATGGNAVPSHVAIAWDGSARSARAVDDALDFLRRAARVIVVTVTGEKDLSRMAPGADLATYLVKHGVRDPQLATIAANDGDVAARLKIFIVDEKVDLLVMGAFVHSRLREAVLGGVTRSMLDETPVPLFMAH